MGKSEEYTEIKEQWVTNLFSFKKVSLKIDLSRFILQTMLLDFRVYQDKLANLKKQLQQLKDGTHPEYNRKLKRLEAQYKER